MLICISLFVSELFEESVLYFGKWKIKKGFFYVFNDIFKERICKVEWKKGFYFLRFLLSINRIGGVFYYV